MFEGGLSVSLCVNKIYMEVCVEIPVPDTDCLENQFLRRSGWQVASREQSMLKEREQLGLKWDHKVILKFSTSCKSL